MFDKVLLDVAKVYSENRIRKGDSWRSCDIDYLRNKLDEKYKEWTDEHSDEYKELLNIINIALMIATRLKQH